MCPRWAQILLVIFVAVHPLTVYACFFQASKGCTNRPDRTGMNWSGPKTEKIVTLGVSSCQHLESLLFRRYIHQYKPSEYTVLQSSSLQHWFKNWQELRRNKLTASTFAGAVGLKSRRRVQLWLEKIGAIEPFTSNLATCWNNIREEEALERYKMITGNDVLLPNFQVHDKKNHDDSWLAASPDGDVYDLPSRGVLEIKCPFFDGDMSRALPWKRIPLYYVPQAQGLLEIMDRDWMDFYVWTVNGSSLFRVYRDEEYWALLKIALSDFWWKHVQPAKQIYKDSVIRNPHSQLRSLKPEPKHELCPSIFITNYAIIDFENQCLYNCMLSKRDYIITLQSLKTLLAVVPSSSQKNGCEVTRLELIYQVHVLTLEFDLDVS
ncbi:uncharacterized protein [Phyllobates terribilis]|uniref:uncharacterized protein n=1 Tax=Phyllobates terribilis TaxID=111132 RepID=UPI003CCAE2FE